MQRQRDDRPDPYILAGLGDPSAVDPHMACFDQRLGKGAALQQPDEEEVTV
jgi:hypothetical protein